MRIVAGEARGRRLRTLDGEDTRPTMERVKEAMFSAVQFWMPGATVLDLFAGSGQLGLEALSRGARCCTFVDDNRDAIAIVRQNVESLGWQPRCIIRRMAADAFVAGCHEQFDLILLDPPYRGGWFPGLLERLARLAAPEGIVLCETEPEAQMPPTVGPLRLEKQYRYGTVMVSRYRREAE